MAFDARRGFTLIELVMVIAIVGVLSVSGAYLLMYLVQNGVFIPNQLNAVMLAADSLEVMIEGDSQYKGLRFSENISAIAANQITFLNQDSQSIRYRLDTGTNKLYRSVNSSAEAPIPYYASGAVNITGMNGTLFRYYDANETPTAVVNNVRLINITLVAATGSGSFQDWEGSSAQASAVAVKRFK